MSAAAIAFTCVGLFFWIAVALVLLASFNNEYLRSSTDWRDQLACIFWPIALPVCWLWDAIQRRRRRLP